LGLIHNSCIPIKNNVFVIDEILNKNNIETGATDTKHCSFIKEKINLKSYGLCYDEISDESFNKIIKELKNIKEFSIPKIEKIFLDKDYSVLETIKIV
jgi:hypothetical protein